MPALLGILLHRFLQCFVRSVLYASIIACGTVAMARCFHELLALGYRERQRLRAELQGEVKS